MLDCRYLQGNYWLDLHSKGTLQHRQHKIKKNLVYKLYDLDHVPQLNYVNWCFHVVHAREINSTVSSV
jgi:hypothetical protein